MKPGAFHNRGDKPGYSFINVTFKGSEAWYCLKK